MGYLRPYLGAMALASLLLAVSGALMAVVVSTIKPLVNQVLLPRFGGGENSVPISSGPDILDRLREWLPVDTLAEWARDHAFVQVPLLIVLQFIHAVAAAVGVLAVLQIAIGGR